MKEMNYKEGLVSVIVPVYNAEKYIEECINSINCQTYQNIDIMLIDDGSEDGSFEKIKEIAKKNPRIYYYQKEPAGAGTARNLGLEYAQGEYIAFLDADDMFFDRDALEKMICACKKNNIPICGSYRNELKNGVLQDTDFMRQFGVLPEEGIDIAFKDYQFDFFFQSFLYSHKLLDRFHIRFKEYFRYEDPPFLVHALDAAGHFHVLPVILHCYRKGHQIRKANEAYIVDSMKGVRDNLLFSEKKYKQLFQILIDRIDWMYKDEIMDNDTEELLIVLGELNEIYRRNSGVELPIYGEYLEKNWTPKCR